MARCLLHLLAIALLASACANVRTFPSTDLDTALRKESETRVEESTKKWGEGKQVGDTSLIIAKEQDTCFTREIDVVDRTTSTVREVPNAELQWMGVIAAIAGGTVAVVMAPTMSTEANTTTDKETGKTQETVSNQTFAYIGGGIAIAGGVGYGGYLTKLAVDAMDTSTHVGEVRLEGQWSKGVACNERPMANRDVQVMYGSDAMREIVSGVTNSEGKFSFPSEVTANEYVKSTSLEKDKLIVLVAGESLLRFDMSHENFAKLFGPARAAYIDAEVLRASEDATAAIKSGDWQDAQAAIESCKAVAPGDTRCLDLEGLSLCRMALQSYKEDDDVGALWSQLESIRTGYAYDESSACAVENQEKINDKFQRAMAATEAEMDRKWAIEEKAREVEAERTGWYSTVFGEDYQQAYYSNQYAGRYAYYYTFAKDKEREEWERADAKNALKKASSGYCKWYKYRVKEYGKDGVHKAIDAYCTAEGGGSIYVEDETGGLDIPTEDCIKILTKPKCK